MTSASISKPGFTWYIPGSKAGIYESGDAYDDEEAMKKRMEWDIHPTKADNPYLLHIKSLSTAWPHLKHLADFMEVTTTPIRWNDLKHKADERTRRAAKTKGCRLDYPVTATKAPTCRPFNTPDKLAAALEAKDNAKVPLRLYVVEDLSRDVIEKLGFHYDIDPAFFRAQIYDYAWYNVRDPWRDPPNLDVTARQRNWIQIRYTNVRYFRRSLDFESARQESTSFNVLRRLQNDLNNNSPFDKDDAIVALTRSKASLWLKPGADNEGADGVLLIDPTVEKAVPLWRGYRNWRPTPELHSLRPVPDGPKQKSFFEDFLYWAQKPEAFDSFLLPGRSPSNADKPLQILLHLVCSEWLTISDYMDTRLMQIEWDISDPDNYIKSRKKTDIVLKKLATWRRLIPLFQVMLSETLRDAFRFPCRATPDENDIESTENTKTKADGHQSAESQIRSISAYRNDFVFLLSTMEKYEKRVDRLTSMIVSVLAIADARRALADHNIARLTWLATIFLPFTLIGTLFCMQADIHAISGETLKLYFATSLPLAALTLGFAFAMSSSKVHEFLRLEF